MCLQAIKSYFRDIHSFETVRRDKKQMAVKIVTQNIILNVIIIDVSACEGAEAKLVTFCIYA